MLLGQFHLGDLEFQYEADTIEELARCQKIQAEVESAERVLRRLSDSRRVALIVDDIESDGKKFTQLRLRAWDGGGKSYTVDFGTTEDTRENPFGIFPKDQEIKVYDRDTEGSWKVDRHGDAIEEEVTGGGGQSKPSGGGKKSKKKTPGEIAGLLKQKISEAPSGRKVEAITVDGNPLSKKLKSFIEYCGRDAKYCKRVLATFEGKPQAFRSLSRDQAKLAVDMIADETYLQSRENKAEEELPI